MIAKSDDLKTPISNQEERKPSLSPDSGMIGFVRLDTEEEEAVVRSCM